MHHAHAAAAAAARGLDDHRIADVLGDAEVLVGVLAQGPVRAGNAGNARGLHVLDGGYLVSHHADGFRPGTDKNEAALLDPLGEIGILRQEAVSRVNRDRVGDLGRADDGGHVEVRQGGWRRPDTHGFVRQQHMLGVEIRGGVHRDGLDAQLAAGAQYPKCDLAAVRDDDFFDHRGYSMMNSGWPNSTGSPFFASMAVPFPPCRTRFDSSSSWPR